MAERPIVLCADCKGDVRDQVPVLLVSSQTCFACLCPRCAVAYGSTQLAFERLRALLPSPELPWDGPPTPEEFQAA